MCHFISHACLVHRLPIMPFFTHVFVCHFCPLVPPQVTTHGRALSLQGVSSRHGALACPHPRGLLGGPPLSGCEPFSPFGGPFLAFDILPRVLKRSACAQGSFVKYFKRLKLLKGTRYNLHYRHMTSLAQEMQRLNGKSSPFHPQVDSIDWGVMSLCRHSRNHLNQFFRLSWYLYHLRFLQIPKQKNKMKILNCQHLRKKKVHQRSRRRSQMTMMSHLSILPDMILHLHPIIIRTIQRICRFNMKVRKS